MQQTIQFDHKIPSLPDLPATTVSADVVSTFGPIAHLDIVAFDGELLVSVTSLMGACAMISVWQAGDSLPRRITDPNPTASRVTRALKNVDVPTALLADSVVQGALIGIFDS